MLRLTSHCCNLDCRQNCVRRVRQSYLEAALVKWRSLCCARRSRAPACCPTPFWSARRRRSRTAWVRSSTPGIGSYKRTWTERCRTPSSRRRRRTTRTCGRTRRRRCTTGSYSGSTTRRITRTWCRTSGCRVGSRPVVRAIRSPRRAHSLSIQSFRQTPDDAKRPKMHSWYIPPPSLMERGTLLNSNTVESRYKRTH